MLYCWLDEVVQAVIKADGRLRQRGPVPDLTDAEVLTVQIWGEMLGLPSDAAIWRAAVATTWASLRCAGVLHIPRTARVRAGTAAQLAVGKARSISALRQSILSCGIWRFDAARLRDHSA